MAGLGETRVGVALIAGVVPVRFLMLIQLCLGFHGFHGLVPF